MDYLKSIHLEIKGIEPSYAIRTHRQKFRSGGVCLTLVFDYTLRDHLVIYEGTADLTVNGRYIDNYFDQAIEQLITEHKIYYDTQ